MTEWPTKDPEEAITVAFVYSDELGDETLSPGTPVVTLTVLEGTDADPAALLNGAPVIDGGTVYQSIRNGVDGVIYKPRCRADTSGGRRLVRTASLPVRTL